ncbi:hypothetical protein ACPV30_14080 [Photobacterium damselae]|uniref:Uncharacterized protein n=1 Tax=Photobacterium damselae TaxID=38293 RepID=A0ACD3T317_PHODM|nr:hypothetical protein [Photobacterium damselae]RDL31599.1 hypothetical protein BC461_08970 [Photobacterium damselae]TMX50581.1 hypothetical protein DA099_08755 [Photobacterium damselae]TMX66646.1 hypothetical protein DA090_07980 [Photobacterium damselae]TMX74956.1 hypothetical protein DA092_11020 [Photobacterium damselae]
MKKTISILATLSALGFAQTSTAADIGTAAFQWTGTVPAMTASNSGYWIVNASGSAILDANDGVMVFSNTKDKGIQLATASTFGFKVVSDITSDSVSTPDGVFNPAVDNTVVGYQGALVEQKAGANGLVDVGGDDGYFAVTADGTPLVAGAAQGAISKQNGSVTNITLAPATDGSSFTKANANEKWNVQAIVALSTISV